MMHHLNNPFHLPMEYQPRVSNPPKGPNLGQIAYKATLNTCSDWHLWR